MSILYLIFASPVYHYQVQEGDQGLAECFCQYLPSLSVKSSPRPHCTTLSFHEDKQNNWVFVLVSTCSDIFLVYFFFNITIKLIYII